MFRKRPELGIPLLMLAAVGLPAFLCFNYVYRFGVDVPYADDWELVPLVDHWLDGTITVDDLFQQHNEHRIFWPRLAMLAAVSLVHYDLRALMVVGFIMLAAMVAMLTWEHASTFGRSASSYALWAPVAWAFFSPRQYENLTWGWQLQFFMCSCSFAASMFFLQTAKPLWRFGVALAFALIASFTIAAGLVTWPAGAVFLFALFLMRRERRQLAFLVAWLVVGAAATALYLRGYHSIAGHPDPYYLASRPLSAVRYVLVALGSPYSHEAGGALAAGMVLACLCGLTLLAWRMKALNLDRAVFALPFAVFALAFVAMIAVGRGAWGDGSALASRYTTLTVFFGFAVQRACLAITWPRLKGPLVGVLVCLAALMVTAFFDRAWAEGRSGKATALENAEILRDFRNRSDDELKRLYPDPGVVRERAPILERHGLSVFHARSVDGAPQ